MKCPVPNSINTSILPERLAERLKGQLHYLTDDRASWYILARRWWPCSGETEFQQQWDLHPEQRHKLKLFGRTVAEKRWSQSWGVAYRYSGATNPARPIMENGGLVQDLINAANDLVAIQQQQQDRRDDDSSCARPYNAVLQNWYLTDDSIGKHSDDESSNRTDVPIFSLSWGGTRRFLFRAKGGDSKQKTELYLEDGDLLVMGGTCQQTHHHEVPKVRKTMDPPTARRINFTVRAFVGEPKK